MNAIQYDIMKQTHFLIEIGQFGDDFVFCSCILSLEGPGNRGVTRDMDVWADHTEQGLESIVLRIK